MLACWLTTILPDLTLAESLEPTCIHRVAGLTGARTALVTTRLCRAPRGSHSNGTKNVKVPQLAINIVITVTFNAPRLWKVPNAIPHAYRGG
jgi:Magnesium chelatase, subunit ChlI